MISESCLPPIKCQCPACSDLVDFGWCAWCASHCPTNDPMTVADGYYLRELQRTLAHHARRLHGDVLPMDCQTNQRSDIPRRIVPPPSLRPSAIDWEGRAGLAGWTDAEIEQVKSQLNRGANYLPPTYTPDGVRINGQRLWYVDDVHSTHLVVSTAGASPQVVHKPVIRIESEPQPLPPYDGPHWCPNHGWSIDVTCGWCTTSPQRPIGRCYCEAVSSGGVLTTTHESTCPLTGTVTTDTIGEVQLPADALDLVCIDTETTGLSYSKNAILEIAAVHCDPTGQTIYREFVCTVRPWEGAEISDRALEVNKHQPRSQWWLDKALPLREALQQLAEMLPSKWCWLGQNVPFDRGFIAEALKREPVVITKPLAYHDTKALGERLKKQGMIHSASLYQLCIYFGIPNKGAHSALVDVKRTIAVYRQALKDGLVKVPTPEKLLVEAPKKRDPKLVAQPVPGPTSAPTSQLGLFGK